MELPSIKVQFSFQTALPDYPVSCRIANPALFGKVLPDGELLVFGGYDLVFCCSLRQRSGGNFYRTVILPGTLTEKILPEKTGFVGGERVEIELKHPLIAQVRPGKPSGVGIWRLLAGLFRDRVWVEVVIEGEIALKPAGSPLREEDARQASRRDAIGAAGIREKEAPEVPAGNQAGKNGRREPEPGGVRISDKIALDLDSLAYLVGRVIEQREKGALPEGPARGLADPGEKQELQPAGRSEEESCSDILRRYAARSDQGQGQQKGGFAAKQEFAGYDLSSIPLELIPSRPGLEKTFVQETPPSKPPEYGG